VGQGASRRLGGWMIEKSGDTVCDPHRTRVGDEKHGFGGLCLKTTMTIFLVWVLKPREEVCRFAPQNRRADEDGVRIRVGI
jgi:hypothetical protein